MDPQTTPLASSYRDPSGFMFEKDGVLYRQVNLSYKQHYDQFISGGTYERFVKSGRLVSHHEVDTNLTGTPNWYKTLQPERIPFISYPWEWSFDMLKDAALTTLELALDSMHSGMMLKDASAFNIQFRDGQPVFIDTLSFERYEPAQPWIAYRQFCEQFLAPLLLMHYSQQDLHGLLLAWPEGIPLPIAQSLLPGKSRFSLNTWLHVHLHASLARKSMGKPTATVANFSQVKMLRLLESLRSLVSSLKWKGRATTWKDYYGEAGQRTGYLEAKQTIITGWVNELPPLQTAADLGANEGAFSLPLAAKKIFTIATDFDHEAVNDLYLRIRKENIRNIQPLVMDLANPSPAVGLNNKERLSFAQRTQVDLVLALALVHHLAIGKNIPFDAIAQQMKSIGDYLVIEFVPKEDEKVVFMLKQKEDIYTEYTEANFIRSFETCFHILKKEPVGSSGRTLYLMKRYG